MLRHDCNNITSRPPTSNQTRCIKRLNKLPFIIFLVNSYKISLLNINIVYSIKYLKKKHTHTHTPPHFIECIEVLVSWIGVYTSGQDRQRLRVTFTQI